MNEKRSLAESQFIIGDSRRLPILLGSLPKPNAIITSPPYFDLIDYGEQGQLGFGAESYEAYLDEMRRIFSDCHRHSTPDATMWVICDNFSRDGQLYDLPGELAREARKAGWLLKDIVVWNKVKTRPFSSQGVFRNTVEYVLLLVKDLQNFKFRVHRVSELHGINADYLWKWPERYSPLGRNPSKIWRHQIMSQGTWGAATRGAESKRLHYCPVPQSLIARILDVSTDPGDVILDPFAGSGSVVAQAELMDRIGIGIEINKDFQRAYASTRELFEQAWLQERSIRIAHNSDRVREALLILRLRAVKAMHRFFAGAQDQEHASALRYVSGACVVEPLTAKEMVEKALVESSNKPTELPIYRFRVWTRSQASGEMVALKKFLAGLLREHALLGEIEVEKGVPEVRAIRRLIGDQCFLYKGESGMRLATESSAKRMGPSILPVYANFEVTYGERASVLKSKLSDVERAIVAEVQKAVGGDVERTANYLGTTTSHVASVLADSKRDVKSEAEEEGLPTT